MESKRTYSGQHGEAWYICGYSWVAWIEKSVMPNKTLAAIIELAGEMPDVGQGFTAGKNCPNQYELKEATVIDMHEKLSRATEEMKITTVIIEKDQKNCRILQDVQTGDLKLINDVFDSVVDEGEIDEEKEGSPAEPFYSGMEPHLMIWTNGHCIFGACTLLSPNPPEPEALILQELAKLELPAAR